MRLIRNHPDIDVPSVHQMPNVVMALDLVGSNLVALSELPPLCSSG
jgi:hypothetical protein